MIKGKQINLRLLEENDFDEFHRLYNDIENRGDYYYMGMQPESILKKRYKESGLWDENFGKLLIVDKQDKMLGYINFFKSVSWFPSYEIGYRLFYPTLHKKGIMTESVKLFCNYIFNSKSNINRLEIRTHPKNVASQKVALKCGFIQEGDARGALFHEGKFYDVCQFSFTREDFYKFKK